MRALLLGLLLACTGAQAATLAVDAKGLLLRADDGRELDRLAANEARARLRPMR